MNNFSLDGAKDRDKLLNSIQGVENFNSPGKFTTTDGRTLVVNRQGNLSANWKARLWNWIRSKILRGADTSASTLIKYKLVQLHFDRLTTYKITNIFLGKLTISEGDVFSTYDNAFRENYFPAYLKNDNDPETEKNIKKILSTLIKQQTELEKRTNEKQELKFDDFNLKMTIQNSQIRKFLVDKFNEDSQQMAVNALSNKKLKPINFNADQKKLDKLLKSLASESNTPEVRQWALETLIECKLTHAKTVCNQVLSNVDSNATKNHTQTFNNDNFDNNLIKIDDGIFGNAKTARENAFAAAENNAQEVVKQNVNSAIEDIKNLYKLSKTDEGVSQTENGFIKTKLQSPEFKLNDYGANRQNNFWNGFTDTLPP